MIACIVNDSIEEVIRGNGQDSRADLFQSQLDGISLGNAGPGDHGNYRLDPALPQLKCERDPVKLEQESRLIHLGRELIGEVGDQVFGEPSVDFLIGEYGLPGRFVANIVAKLKALRHKLFRLVRALARLKWAIAR